MKMKQFVSWLLLLLLLLPCVTAQAATPYRTFSLGSDMREVETQTAYDPIRTMTRFGDETLKSPTDLRMGPDGNLYIADFCANAIVKVTPDGKCKRIAQSPDSDGFNGELDEPGEPIIWNGKLIVSCFDCVVDDQKVNTAHEIPATMAMLDIEP